MGNFERCACHSKRPYHKCCRPYHDGAPAENALKLMRSRYCAYAKNIPDYIIATTDTDNPNYTTDHEQWRRELNQFACAARFESLKILEFVDGEETATVTFTAGLMQGQTDCSFTETSQFRRLDGRWFYLSGELAEAE